MKNVKKYFLFIFLTLAGILPAHDTNIPQGFRKLDCQLVPISPLTKRIGRPYQLGQRPFPRMTSKSQSTNWSGYAAFTNEKTPEIGSVSSVSGMWTIPKISPSHKNTFCSCWVGIDGYSNQTVEQIGTEHDWINGRQENYAWVSMYPGPLYEIQGFPLSPNDLVFGSVTYVGQDAQNQAQDLFEVFFLNYTKQAYAFYSISAPSITQRTSSEWIIEAPFLDTILPLAKFSSITFSECITTIKNTTRPIKSKYWKNAQIFMQTDSKKPQVKAAPSDLFFNGKNFKVHWEHQ